MNYDDESTREHLAKTLERMMSREREHLARSNESCAERAKLRNCFRVLSIAFSWFCLAMSAMFVATLAEWHQVIGGTCGPLAAAFVFRIQAGFWQKILEMDTRSMCESHGRLEKMTSLYGDVGAQDINVLINRLQSISD